MEHDAKIFLNWFQILNVYRSDQYYITVSHRNIIVNTFHDIVLKCVCFFTTMVWNYCIPALLEKKKGDYDRFPSLILQLTSYLRKLSCETYCIIISPCKIKLCNKKNRFFFLVSLGFLFIYYYNYSLHNNEEKNQNINQILIYPP